MSERLHVSCRDGSDRHHLRRVLRKPLTNQNNVALWGIPMCAPSSASRHLDAIGWPNPLPPASAPRPYKTASMRKAFSIARLSPAFVRLPRI